MKRPLNSPAQAPAGRKSLRPCAAFTAKPWALWPPPGGRNTRNRLPPCCRAVKHVPYNNLAKLEAAVGDNTAAILLEVVQGEGGVRIGDKAIFPKCSRNLQCPWRSADYRRGPNRFRPHGHPVCLRTICGARHALPGQIPGRRDSHGRSDLQ